MLQFKGHIICKPGPYGNSEARRADVTAWAAQMLPHWHIPHVGKKVQINPH